MARSSQQQISAGIKLVGATLATGLLVAGVALPFVGGMGLVAKSSVTAFEDQKCDTSVLNQKPPQRSVILAADGKPLASFYDQNRAQVPLDKIQEWTRKAVVAIEDRRFYEHHGVDPTGTLRALVKSGTAGEVTQGGSTLTQQYVKQARLYLSESVADRKKATEQTAGRKLSEARCALELETSMAAKYGTKQAKEEIIGYYLNIANFGAGAYGIGVAAQIYFGTTADKLDLAQSALLAGVVNSPTRYNPLTHPKEARKRRHEVLTAMLNQGYITKPQFQQADKSPLVPPGMDKRQAQQRGGRGCANAVNVENGGFFCDYVKSYLTKTLHISEEKLNTGGLTISTTVDPMMQAAAQSSIKGQIGYDRKTTAVMNIVDPKTGYVKAMAVGRNYGSGDRTKTVIPLATKPVTGSGSTYKLFTTIAALRARVPVKDYKLDTYNTTVHDDIKGEVKAYKPENCPQHPNPVSNAGTYEEFIDLHDALYQSSNTFFEALIDQKFGCDLTEVVKAARDLGMTQTLATKNQQSGKPQGDAAVEEHQISFTLGPLSTSPLELASAYGAIDNDGILCPARPIVEIRGADGRPLPGVALPACRQAVDTGIAHTVTQVLTADTDPNAPHATAERANLGQWPTAGKTGTSQNNAAVWFVGYTKQLVASVGVFQPDTPNAPIEDLDVPSNAQFGGRYPALIWHDAMLPIMQALYPPEAFPPADDAVMNGDSVPVPTVVGMDVETAKSILTQAGFQPVLGQPKDGPADKIVDQSPRGRAAPNSIIYLYPGNGQGGGGGGGGTGGGGRGGGHGGGDIICLPGTPGCPP